MNRNGRAALALCLCLCLWASNAPATDGATPAVGMSFSDLLRRAAAGEVAKLAFTGEHAAVAVTRDGASHDVSIPFVGVWTVDMAQRQGVDVDYGPYDKSRKGLLDSASAVLFPLMQVGFLLIVGLMAAFMLRLLMARRGVGTWVLPKGRVPFGGTKAPPPTRFSDVAGAEEAKAALEEVVSSLRDAARYAAVGAEGRRGVLLVGDPGNGKTLLARAVAGEAGVPFLATSGSDFQEMFAGLGAARVRGIFKQLRKRSPAILFIDEIDSVGRARSQGSSAVENDAAATLNQLLTELDGLSGKADIVVIAATNRPDVLDPALVRSGRFDLRVQVPNPDMVAREAILGIHARSRTLANDVDLATVARGTPGLSGADLANLVNEAAILAVRRGADALAMADLDDARDARLLGGTERRPGLLDEDEAEVVIAHESGHALLGTLLEHCDPIHKATVTPRGRSLGHVASVPLRDQVLMRKSKALDQMCMLLGGRAAEAAVFGDDAVTSGAAADIEAVTSMARDMVARFGMGSTMASRHDESTAFTVRPVSEASRAAVDREVEAVVAAQFKRAQEMVKRRRPALDDLRNAFRMRDTLTGEEIAAIVVPASRPVAAE